MARPTSQLEEKATNEADARTATASTLESARGACKKNTVKAYALPVKLWTVSLAILIC